MVVECVLLTRRDGLCELCGTVLTGRKKRWCSRKCDRLYVANHRWTQAKAAVKAAAARYECAECHGFFGKVEIDHLVPCKGKHALWGCWHHLDGLRALCSECHKKKTNEDRSKGWT